RTRDNEHAALIECDARLAVICGLFFQSHRPAQAILVAGLDSAGILQSFLNETLGNFRCAASCLEVNRFHHRRGTLALVGFREACYSAAERRHGSGFIVSMLSAQPSRRYQEAVRNGDLLEQSAHGGIERLDSNPDSIFP